MLSGLFVARGGGSAKAAALVAVPVLPVAFVASRVLEGALLPHFYWYFIPVGGWAAYYIWEIGLIASPVLAAIAALIAGGTAFVFRRRRRQARQNGGQPAPADI